MWQFHPRDLPDSHQHIYTTKKKKSILKAFRPCEKENWCVFSELSFQLLHNYIQTCHNISLWNHNLETSKKSSGNLKPHPEHPDTSENCELAIHSSLGLLLDLSKAFWAHWPFPWTGDQMSQGAPTGGSQSIHNFLLPVFEAYRTEANPQHCTSCHRAEPKVSRTFPGQWELPLKKC